MVKKIGNIAAGLLFFCFFSSLAQSELALQVKDMNGEVVRAVAVGMPFMVEVCVEGDDGASTQTPVVTGLKQFHSQQSGVFSTVTTVRGVRKIKKIYRYTVRADKIGRFTLGPAEMQSSQGAVTSNKLRLSVTDTPTAQEPDDEQPSLVVRTDKKCVLVGEKIPVTIRFYADPACKVQGIAGFKPSLGCKTYGFSGPRSGSELVQGKTRTYREWTTEIIPQASGSLILPSLKLDYMQERKKRNDQHDLFMQLVGLSGAHYAVAQVYANPVIVTVDPLPQLQTPVDGIGVFHRVTLSIDHETAREGEAVVCSLSVYGDGNWEEMKHPVLHLPDGLGCYESKSSLVAGSKNREMHKKFEYIIQGLKPGAYTIPEQKFVYFDTNTRSSTTITSNSATLSITPLTHTVAHAQKEALGEEVKVQHTIPYFVGAPSQPIQPITWRWFLFITLLPGVYVLWLLGYRNWKHYLRSARPAMRAQHAFATARKSLNRAEKTGDFACLYALMMAFFSDRARLNQETASLEQIERFVEQAGIDRSARSDLMQLMGELSSFVYFKNTSDSIAGAQLFNRVREQLDYLEKRL